MHTTRESKGLRRLRQQAALTDHAPGLTVEVGPGRILFRIGPIKLRIRGYTITVHSRRQPASLVRVRTVKSGSDLLRGISLHSLHTRP